MNVRAPRAPAPADRALALGLGIVTFLVLLATERAIGFPRDESFYFYAADAIARWLRFLAAAPAAALSDRTISVALDYNHEHPLVMKTLFALSSMLFHDALGWVRPATAYRLPAFAVAATIPAVLHLFGSSVYGRKVGLFAALSFYVVPRQFFQAHLACFDIPIAAAWLWTVYLYWRAETDPLYWLWFGISFGVAISIKHNAQFLPFVLVPLCVWRAERLTRGKPHARRLAGAFVGLYAALVVLFALLVVTWGLEGFLAHFILLSPQTGLMALGAAGTVVLLMRLWRVDREAFRALAPIGAMAILGPAIFYLHWPYLWYHPVDRTAWYIDFHATHVNYAWFYLNKLLRGPPFPLEYVLVVTALTVPLTLIVPMTVGLGALLVRAGKTALRKLGGWSAFNETDYLIGANALASIVLLSLPDVPHFGGVKHWFPSMPFLALLAGDSVMRAVQAGSRRWPAFDARTHGWGFTALMFLGLLLPAATYTAHSYAYGTSAYGELAGGLPGAASLGMQRQFWSNNVSGVLPTINQVAPPGARVWLHEVTGLAFQDYQLNGMLRPDLRPAGGPQDADIAAYQYHQEFREQEMDIWQAFGTQKPSFGLYLDETPQVIVYRRR